MPRARRTLGLVAAAWLFCQVGTLGLVPTLLAIDAIDAIDTSAVECTCMHGANATCPMHHRPLAGAKTCALQGVTTSGVVLVNALLGFAGLLPAPTHASNDEPARPTGRRDRSTATSRRIAPDSPPPRS